MANHDSLIKMWYIISMRNNKGQNLAEYIFFVTAVLLVCVYFFAPFSGAPMYNAVNGTINSIVNQINIANSQLQLPIQDPQPAQTSS